MGSAGPSRIALMDRIIPAVESDTPVILEMIGVCGVREVDHLVIATEGKLRASLFGPRPAAEVLLGYYGANAPGWLCFSPTTRPSSRSPGLFLEDLYVKPHLRVKAWLCPAGAPG